MNDFGEGAHPSEEEIQESPEATEVKRLYRMVDNLKKSLVAKDVGQIPVDDMEEKYGATYYNNENGFGFSLDLTNPFSADAPRLSIEGNPVTYMSIDDEIKTLQDPEPQHTLWMTSEIPGTDGLKTVAYDFTFYSGGRFSLDRHEEDERTKDRDHTQKRELTPQLLETAGMGLYIVKSQAAQIPAPSK